MGVNTMEKVHNKNLRSVIIFVLIGICLIITIAIIRGSFYSEKIFYDGKLVLDFSFIIDFIRLCQSIISNIHKWFQVVSFNVYNLLFYTVGKFIFNGPLIVIRKYPKIFIIIASFINLIFSFSLGSLLYTHISPVLSKIKTITLSTFGGLLVFCIFSVYSITIFVSGAWERQYPFYWNWPIFISYVFIIWIVFYLLSLFNEEITSADVNINILLSCALFILIIFNLSQYIYHINEPTVIKAKIKADYGWQFIPISVHKNQKIEFTCTGSSWTTNIADLNNFPFVNPSGYSNNISDAKESLYLLPLETKPLGILISKIGLSERIIPIGTGTSFPSTEDGFIYLRINDSDKSLWDNKGYANCTVKVYRPILFRDLSLKEYFVYLFGLYKAEIEK
jgi:hypothetical protein